MKTPQNLPEFVYLVTAKQLESIIESRRSSGGRTVSSLQVRAWRARLTDIHAIELRPAQMIPPVIVVVGQHDQDGS
jgi:hypothetical protein